MGILCEEFSNIPIIVADSCGLVNTASTSQRMTYRSVEPFLILLLRALDALSGPVSFLLISWYHGVSPPYPREVALSLFCLILIVAHHLGIYRSWRFSSPRQELSRILSACAAVYFILLVLVYFFSISHWFSRLVLVQWMIGWPVLVILQRSLIRAILRVLRRKGWNIKNIVIVGANDIGRILANRIRENPWSGTELLGFFDDRNSGILEYPLLGKINHLSSFLTTHHVDIVYIALPLEEQARIPEILRCLSDSNVSIYVIPDFLFIDMMIGGYLTYFEDLPVVALEESPLIGLNRLTKRTFDLVVSLFFLVVLAPVLGFVAVAIRMSGPGPVIFRQWRYGLNGHPIQVYKFRTMTVCEDGYEFCQATRNDPRVTRFGSFLRKYSLDELPQLFNVVAGSMSMVGPRPHPAAMNEQYRRLLPGYMLRHKVKPGITGLAQIHGYRGETDTLEKIEKRLQYDLEYIRTWSVWSDVHILLATIYKGAWRTNAY